MAKNLRDKGYSSSTSGTSTKGSKDAKKTATNLKDKGYSSGASGVKEKLQNAYANAKDSLGVKTYRDSGENVRNVYGNPVSSAGAFVPDVAGVGYSSDPNFGTRVGGYVRTAEDYSRPEYEREIATPLGTFDYGQDYDTRYAGYTSPIKTNSEDRFSNVVYNNPMTNGGHYDDFNDAYVQANTPKRSASFLA